MAAAEASPYNSPPPDLRYRQRGLIFDLRYGWIFDEWADPGAAALAGGRGILVLVHLPATATHRFCILPMAQSLMNAAASSVNHAADSVSRALEHPEFFSPLSYPPHQALHRNQQAWFREIQHSGVTADSKLIPHTTHRTLECMTTKCN